MFKIPILEFLFDPSEPRTESDQTALTRVARDRTDTEAHQPSHRFNPFRYVHERLQYRHEHKPRVGESLNRTAALALLALLAALPLYPPLASATPECRPPFLNVSVGLPENLTIPPIREGLGPIRVRVVVENVTLRHKVTIPVPIAYINLTVPGRAFRIFGKNVTLPAQVLEALREHVRIVGLNLTLSEEEKARVMGHPRVKELLGQGYELASLTPISTFKFELRGPVLKVVARENEGAVLVFVKKGADYEEKVILTIFFGE